MPDSILDTLAPAEVGERLQHARKRAGLTQQQAAEIIDAARTTMVAIEKGSRALRPIEFVALVRAYGLQVSDFMAARPDIKPFDVQFRAVFGASQQDEAIRPVIERWEKLCLNYLELEEALGAPLPRNYPEEYSTARMPVDLCAKHMAVSERRRLGLGDGPISRLRDILEQEVGLRVFALPMPPQYSEMYTYDESLGGCLAVNSNHPAERQRWSLAHGYSHFLAHRHKAEIDQEGRRQRKLESDRLADAFATYFLLPTVSVTMRFDAYRRDGKFSPADLVMLADYYGVGVQALTLRLEGLKLLSAGTWDLLESRGFRVRDAQKKLGLRTTELERVETYPLYYQSLAIEAFDEGLITESRFAGLLGVSRIEAREIAEVLRQHSSGMDEGGLTMDLSKRVPDSVS